jgi:hypothetical protein
MSSQSCSSGTSPERFTSLAKRWANASDSRRSASGEPRRRLVALEGGEDRPLDRSPPHPQEAVVRHADERRGQDGEEGDVVVAVPQEAQIREQVGHLLRRVVAAARRSHRAQMALAKRRLVHGGVRPGLEESTICPGVASPASTSSAIRPASASASAPRQLSPASRNPALSVRSSSTRPPAGGSPGWSASARSGV